MAAPLDYGRLLDALRGVSWPARVASRAATSGVHPSRLRGTSAEFTEYRAYRQGDDPRRLDWKLLARTDRAYLRITNERATMPTLLAVDASASMLFPQETDAKWATARRLAVGLTSVAHAAGDPVGLVVAGPAPREVPFRSRRGVVTEVARVLGMVEPAKAPELAPMLRARPSAARLAIITDLLGDEPALLALAGERVARGVDVTVIHVVAVEELAILANAELARDPERPEIERGISPTGRAEYRAAFDAWRADRAAAWRAAGARYLQVLTDEPADRAVRRIVAR